MAFSRDVRVNVIGDSRSLERAFARSSAATKRFGTQTNTTLGKIEGNFTRMQRVAAGGFIGGAIAATGITALKKLIDVSAESQQVLGQTRVAVEATGKSWDQYGKIIQDTVEKQSRMGFDDEALLRTFSLFERNTNDVGKALELNNLAMDVARARFIDLEQAAQLVNKAAIGQAGALRRLGINARTGASSLELLTLLNEKYGGSAEAASKDATTAMDRAKVSVENLQESLGALLLPTVGSVADALDTVAKEADLAVAGLKKLSQVKIPPIRIPFFFDFPGGGTVGSLAGGVAKLATTFQFTGVGGLWFQIGKTIAEQFDNDPSKATSTTQLANDFARSINTMTQNALDQASGQVKAPALRPAGEFSQLPGVHGEFVESIMGPIQKAIDAAKAAAAEAITKGKAAISKEAAQKAAEKQRESFDNLIAAISLGVDRAAATRGFADDLRLNTQLQTAINRQIAVEGRTTELARQLFEARQARAQILADRAAGAKAADEKLTQALQARQFKALGLTATGEEPVPGIKNLAKRINQTLQNANLGKIDISSKLVSRLKAARKLIKTEGTKLTEDTRRIINDFIKAASGQDAKDTTSGPLTKTTALSANRILQGLGLDRDAERELRARLSRFNTAGLALARGGSRAGAATVSTGPVIVEAHTTIKLDSDVVARAVTRSQNRTSRGTRQKRGPNRPHGI